MARAVAAGALAAVVGDIVLTLRVSPVNATAVAVTVAADVLSRALSWPLGPQLWFDKLSLQEHVAVDCCSCDRCRWLPTRSPCVSPMSVTAVAVIVANACALPCAFRFSRPVVLLLRY